GEVLWTLGGHTGATRWGTFDIRDLVFRPDGEQLASLSTDGTVRLWSVEDGDCSPSPVLNVRSGRPGAIAYTEDGSHLAVAVEGAGAQLWDARTGDRVTPLEGCTEDAVGIALDGRGRVLVG